jgi:hypothetical protein
MVHSTDDRYDIYRYILSALWAAAFIWYTPSALLPVLTPATTWIPMCVVIVGSGVAGVGRYRNEHLRVELWGVLGVFAGFGFYLLLNIILIIFATPERLAQTLLVLLAMLFVVERLRVLLPKLHSALRGER